MTTVELPYLWLQRITKRGRTYTYAYYRPNRCAPPIRIKAADGSFPLPGDPQFLDAYNALHRASAPEVKVRAPGSLAALIESYKRDAHWHELSERTRHNYTKLFSCLERDYGEARVTALDRVGVFKVRKRYAKPDAQGRPTTPAQANNIISALSTLIRSGTRSTSAGAKTTRARSRVSYGRGRASACGPPKSLSSS